MANPAKAIHLPQELQAFAEERVRAGEYASVDDVAAAAVRLLKQRDARRENVRQELGEIFDEMDSGQFVEPTDDEFAQAVREAAAKHLSE